MASDLWFRVLGPVEALRGGQPAAVGRGSAVCVLAALLLSANRVVTADALAELAWDASAGPANPRAALRSVVLRLRRALGAGVDARVGHSLPVRHLPRRNIRRPDADWTISLAPMPCHGCQSDRPGLA